MHYMVKTRYNIHIMRDIHFSDQFLNKRMFDVRTIGLNDPPNIITEFGYFPQARYHYIRRDNGAAEHIFILCSQGEGIVEIDHKSYRIYPMSYIVIPRRTPHVYYANNDHPWSIYWFHFNDDIEIDPGEKLLSALPYNFIVAAFQLLLNEDFHARKSLAYLELTYQYIRETMRPDDHKPIINEHVELAMQYIKEHIVETIALQDIATYCHLSVSQLSHLFKTHLQTSPFSYFLKLKVEYAANLLVMTNLTIKDIAQRLSIEDPFYFSRLFKRHMGVSPLNFKRHNRR